MQESSNNNHTNTDPNEAIATYLGSILKCITDLEQLIRHRKLSKPFWNNITPYYVNQIALQLFLRSTELITNGGDDFISIEQESHGCLDPFGQKPESIRTGGSSCPPVPTEVDNATNSSLSINNQEVFKGHPAERNIDGYHDPLVDCDLEQQLAAAAQIQHTLTPLLIRFWQKVPQQLRQKVKQGVVESLCLRVNELQQLAEQDQPYSLLEFVSHRKPHQPTPPCSQSEEVECRRRSLCARLERFSNECVKWCEPSSVSSCFDKTLEPSRQGSTDICVTIMNNTAAIRSGLCNTNNSSSIGHEQPVAISRTSLNGHVF